MVSLCVQKIACRGRTMSDTEEARDSLMSCLEGIDDWIGPITMTDFTQQCCDVHGVKMRPDRRCYMLENVLSKAECAALVAATREHHAAEADGLEPGCRSQFVSDDPDLSDMFWGRIRAFVPEQLDGGQAIGLLKRVAHAQYFDGQVGFAHIDFRHGSRTDPCVSSRISFTVYLNDDFDGGELDFIGELRMDGTHGPSHISLPPKAGAAVLFYQALPEFAHLPHQVRRCCKNILRADVMYRFKDKDTADVGCVVRDPQVYREMEAGDATKEAEEGEEGKEEGSAAAGGVLEAAGGAAGGAAGAGAQGSSE